MIFESKTTILLENGLVMGWDGHYWAVYKPREQMMGRGVAQMTTLL